jgi:hypothetical protein
LIHRRGFEAITETLPLGSLYEAEVTAASRIGPTGGKHQ